MTPYFAGISAPTRVATTPGYFSASLTSIPRIRACACGERRIFAWSMRGKRMSSV